MAAVNFATSTLTEALVRASCQNLDLTRHPSVAGLSRDTLYDHGRWMAPGGLLLANVLAQELPLKAGDRVLDLGCGRGQSSIFLASRFGAQVVSLDLWIDAAERRRRADSAGVADQITHLQGDIARGVPIEPGSLDAIVSLQAFHCFGTPPGMLRYLCSLLKPGGHLAIAQGCFRQEVDEFPALFRASDGWNVEYHKYHSPAWWRQHFESHGALTVRTARELRDGDILWQDDLLYKAERAGWSPAFFEHSGWLIKQILHGTRAAPNLTHCLIVGEKS